MLRRRNPDGDGIWLSAVRRYTLPRTTTEGKSENGHEQCTQVLNCHKCTKKFARLGWRRDHEIGCFFATTTGAKGPIAR